MNQLPAHIKLMLHTPLYEEFPISGEEAEASVWNLEYFGNKLDCYCVECKRESVFSREALQFPQAPAVVLQGNRRGSHISHVPHVPVENSKDAKHRLGSDFFVKPRVFAVVLQCSRNGAHKIRFFFEVRNKCLLKIGQFPSIADLSLDELRPYFKSIGTGKIQRTDQSSRTRGAWRWDWCIRVPTEDF